MTKENILERLRAGESPTVIGNELVAILNEAIADKKAEDEAKRKAEEAMAWQMKDAELLAEVMNDYFKKYCGETENVINAEELVAATPELSRLLKITDKMVGVLDNSVNKHKELPVKITFNKKKTGDEAVNWVEEAFADFFKAFDL